MRIRLSGLLGTLLILAPPLLAQQPENIPSLEQLEDQGAVIGEILYDIRPIFDTSDERENKRLYRLANRLHVNTRPSVIRSQLLFRSGEPLLVQRIEESERILRANRYIFDANIKPSRVVNGVVDIMVTTQEIWTLSPGGSISRSGGENEANIEIEEFNLFGTGASLGLEWEDDVDRTSTTLNFSSNNLGRSWVRTDLRYSNADDGDTKLVNLARPFYSLDARWAAGGFWSIDERRERLFNLGDEAGEYSRVRRRIDLFAGISPGLKGNWTRRLLVGFAVEDSDFFATPNGLLQPLIPLDRRLSYPYIGFDVLENRFVETRNFDQIGRTEDFFLGARVAGRLGWNTSGLGAEQEGLVYGLSASRGYGSPDDHLLLLDASVTGRRDEGRSANRLLTSRVRYYYRRSEKTLLFATLEGTSGQRLDLDNLQVIGGDDNLRGYPIRYQTGDSSALLTLEARYFTDWYPLRIFRVGGAVFFDAGRSWGPNPTNEPDQGWLKNVGFGLRLGITKGASKKTVHLDIAFPLDGDPSLDSVQVSLKAKRGF